MIQKTRKKQKSSSEKVKTLSFNRPSQYLAQPTAVDQNSGLATASINLNSPGSESIHLSANQQPGHQYQQQQSSQSQQQVYIDPTTGQIVDPNSWVIAQQNALLAQQQQQQSQLSK
jgi:hypothetical protein